MGDIEGSPPPMEILVASVPIIVERPPRDADAMSTGSMLSSLSTYSQENDAQEYHPEPCDETEELECFDGCKVCG